MPEQINMKSYVSIRGSGQEATVLVSRMRSLGSHRAMIYGRDFRSRSTSIRIYLLICMRTKPIVVMSF